MVMFSIMTKDDTGRKQPDIFNAAANDDPIEMNLALQGGQSLDDADPDGAGTPLHLAAKIGALEFIKAAVANGNFDPWILDRNGRTALDHSRARGAIEAQTLLFSVMYPELNRE